MTNAEILRKALDRYRSVTHGNTAYRDDVIIFLEKEIDRCRETIQHMEYNVERLTERIKTMDLFSESLTEVAQERPTARIIKALADNGYKTITLNFYKD